MLLFAARAAMQVAEQGAAHRLCSCAALHVSVRRTERESSHAQNAAVTLGDCRQPVPAVLPSSEAVDARLPRVYRPHSSSRQLACSWSRFLMCFLSRSEFWRLSHVFAKVRCVHPRRRRADCRPSSRRLQFDPQLNARMRLAIHLDGAAMPSVRVSLHAKPAEP